jgi:hypothetical protein
MPCFRRYNDYQDVMVVTNYQDQIQPGSFEYAVHTSSRTSWICRSSIPGIATRTLDDWPTILLKIIRFAY